MEERPKADEEYLTEEQLRQRISQPVPYCFGKEYSKLSAIARIAAEVSDGEALTEDAGRQLAREVQWLLADRGILFAQTRTRHYPPRYNWQITAQAQAFIPAPSACERGDWCEPYEDTLACNRDLKKYGQMVDRNARWDQEKFWATWKTAAPAIQEYLHPETLWGTGKVNAVPISKSGMEQVETEFAELFQDYLKELFKAPSDHTGDPLQENECADKESEAVTVAERCAWNELLGMLPLSTGKQSKSTDGQPNFYLIQHPGELFHLVRLPWRMKDFANTAKRERPVIRILKQCDQERLPVTAQTWWLDKPLLKGIINACEKGCNLAGLPFQWEAWYALVDCLDQCVESVSFSVDALCGFRRQWTNLLRVTVPGKLQEVRQPLEQTLQTRYEGKDASCYLTALWRLLENGEMTETWQERAQQYRQAFENPATESEDIRKILDGIPHFGWTQIPMNLYDEECARAKGQFPRGQGKRIIEEINARIRNPRAQEKTASAKERKAKSKGDRHMELFVLEWALLQTICGQSVQELLGSAAVLAKYVPSPEKQPGAK